MKQEEYRKYMKDVVPSPALKEETLEKMLDAAGGRSAVRRPARRVAAAALALVLSLTLTLGAAAVGADLGGFRSWLFGPDSGVAEKLTPMAVESETDGLRLEILGAMSDESGVAVYFNLQDTGETKRLNENSILICTAELSGSYLADGDHQGVSSATRLLEFDPETCTGLYRFDMSTGDYDASGAKIKLILKILYPMGPELQRADYLPLDPTALGMTEETIVPELWLTYSDRATEDHRVELDVTGVTEIDEDDPEQYRCLKPGEGTALPGWEFSPITAVGFVNGKLHIQTLREDSLAHDFDILCADAGQGEALAAEIAELKELTRLTAGASADPELYALRQYRQTGGVTGFTLDEEGRMVLGSLMEGVYYHEQVFDISPEELENYEFFAVGSLYEAPAEEKILPFLTAEFKLDKPLKVNGKPYIEANVEEVRTATGKTSLEEVRITPLGVRMTGNRHELADIGRDVVLVYGEEKVPCLMFHVPGSFYNEEYWKSIGVELPETATVGYITTGVPRDFDGLTAIEIAGARIELG